MIKQQATWILSSALGLAVLAPAQQPERIQTPDEAARREVIQAQENFLKAHPTLEKEIRSAPVAKVRAQISGSRELAAKYAAAKVAYYKQMAGLSADELKRLNAQRLGDPAALKADFEAATGRVSIMRAEYEALDGQLESTRRRLANAQGAERKALEEQFEQLKQQHETTKKIVNLHLDEVKDMQALRDLTDEARKRHGGMVLRKQAQSEAYRELLNLAETSGARYNDYFDALDQIVDEREGRKKKGK